MFVFHNTTKSETTIQGWYILFLQGNVIKPLENCTSKIEVGILRIKYLKKKLFCTFENASIFRNFVAEKDSCK